MADTREFSSSMSTPQSGSANLDITVNGTTTNYNPFGPDRQVTLNLATVATTGSYNDLNDRPAITTAPYQLSAKVYTSNASADPNYKSHYVVSNGGSPITLSLTAEALYEGYPYEFGSALNSGLSGPGYTLEISSTLGNVKVYGYRYNGTTITSSISISIKLNVYLVRVGTNLYIIGY